MKWTMQGSAQLDEVLASEGFRLVPGVIAPKRLSGLVDEAEALLQTGKRPRAGTLHALRDALGISPTFRRIATGTSVLSLARKASGASARPVRAILFDKPKTTNWKVPWHQDLTVALRERRTAPGFGPWSIKGGVVHATAPENILSCMITLRIHLDDCPADNGALMVVPGSHREGKLTATQCKAIASKGEARTCIARAGDILMMRPLLLHRSSAARSPRHRRILHIEYGPSELPCNLRWAF